MQLPTVLLPTPNSFRTHRIPETVFSLEREGTEYRRDEHFKFWSTDKEGNVETCSSWFNQQVD